MQGRSATELWKRFGNILNLGATLNVEGTLVLESTLLKNRPELEIGESCSNWSVV